MTTWRFAAATDTGRVREANQDAVYVDDHVAIVADGMGGHAAGEVASALTIDAVREFFHRQSTVAGLVRAIEAANDSVLADSRENPEHQGMGTTVIALGLTENYDGSTSPTLFHVGDSRAYQLRDGALRQLSVDHSLTQEWVQMGRLTPQEALVHPRRHQLTRAVGIGSTIEVDVQSLDVIAGDRVVLCSDGLSNELSEDVLAELASAPSLETAVRSLVDAANAAGGRDNISVILVEFDEVSPAPLAIATTGSLAPPSSVTRERSQRAVSVRRVGATVRWLVALLFLLAVGAGGYAVVHWYAYSSYYLTAQDGHIVIFQGQPGGVVGWKPREVWVTHYSTRQLQPGDLVNLRATISEPTLSAALHYAHFLHNQWAAGQATTTTTTVVTTTTSTLPAVTTTTVAG